MRFVAGRGAVAELLLAGALREGWSEAEVCAQELAAQRGPLWRERSAETAAWKSLPLLWRRCGEPMLHHREAAGRGPGRRRWSQGAEPGSRCLLTAN